MTTAPGCALFGCRAGTWDLGYLFSFQGRANREEFWQIHSGMSVVQLIAIAFAGTGTWILCSVLGVRDQRLGIVFLAVVVAIVPFGVVSVATWVRRAHDLGISGWWAAAQMFFGLGWFPLFVLGLNDETLAVISGLMVLTALGIGATILLREGSPEPNRYGDAVPSRVWPKVDAVPVAKPRTLDEELKLARTELDETKRKLGG
jgi:uncharacterized membrane protein YhaH (DUF805 family)